MYNGWHNSLEKAHGSLNTPPTNLPCFYRIEFLGVEISLSRSRDPRGKRKKKRDNALLVFVFARRSECAIRSVGRFYEARRSVSLSLWSARDPRTSTGSIYRPRFLWILSLLRDSFYGWITRERKHLPPVKRKERRNLPARGKRYIFSGKESWK